jgi:hypothetical protein
LLAEGLAAQRRLEFIPAVLRKISYTARDGERYAFEGMLADSGASCSVLDEGSARQLVRDGVAEIFPLESGDLTAIHGVGGHRRTSGVRIVKLSCWCADAKEWVDFQILAFVLKRLGQSLYHRQHVPTSPSRHHRCGR